MATVTSGGGSGAIGPPRDPEWWKGLEEYAPASARRELDPNTGRTIVRAPWINPQPQVTPVSQRTPAYAPQPAPQQYSPYGGAPQMSPYAGRYSPPSYPQMPMMAPWQSTYGMGFQTYGAGYNPFGSTGGMSPWGLASSVNTGFPAPQPQAPILPQISQPQTLPPANQWSASNPYSPYSQMYSGVGNPFLNPLLR